jgi:preprotein translocase subunit SecG
MAVLFTVLILLASSLLILIVLVQNSKGGGLAANFSSSNQMLGVRKTTDFLEKATWILSITIVVLSIAASLSITGVEEEVDPTKSMLEDQIENWEDQTMPTLPNPNAATKEESKPTEIPAK